MGALETLIKVKQMSKTDDILVMIDEIIMYEKLSKVAAFKDLTTSEVTQKKLPLLTEAYKGEPYHLILFQAAQNIITYLDQSVSESIAKQLEQDTKQNEKQFSIMQKQIINISYLDLLLYNKDTDEKNIVGIFESQQAYMTAIVIIVRDKKGYKIYQGYYDKSNTECSKKQKAFPYIYQRDPYILEITTYSIQGNNAYPFGVLKGKHGIYTVSQPFFDRIWVIPEKEKDEKLEIELTMDERNALSLAKCEIKTFAPCIMELVTGRGLNL